MGIVIADVAAEYTAWGVYITLPDKQGWMQDHHGFPALWSEEKACSFLPIPGTAVRKLCIAAYDITESMP